MSVARAPQPDRRAASSATDSGRLSSLSCPAPPPSKPLRRPSIPSPLGKLSIPTTTRVVSNPTPPRRRIGTGGFLLDTNNSKRSSLDRSRLSLDTDPNDNSIRHIPSFTSGAPTFADSDASTNAEKRATTSSEDVPDSELADMVELVLQNSQRKRENTRNGNVTTSTTGSVTATNNPQVRRHRAVSGRRNISPTSSFLVQGRSSMLHSPLFLAAPKTLEEKDAFLTPVLARSATAATAATAVHRKAATGPAPGTHGEEKFDISEATLQRTRKAKQSLELGMLYFRLLDIEGNRKPDAGTPCAPTYNPLQVIRNRRKRNRQKMQLDVSEWEDPVAVGSWVEAVEASPYAAGAATKLPKPPQSLGKKMKRPRMDWIVTPEELLADYYWTRTEEAECERPKPQATKAERFSVDSKRNRMSKELTGWSWNTDKDGVEGMPDSRRQTENYSYESTATSSDDSDSDVAFETDFEVGEAAEENPNHHRRRRRLGRIIKGPHNKRKQIKQYRLEVDAQRQRRDLENVWTASDRDDKGPIPMTQEQPEYRHSLEYSDGYASLSAGARSPRKQGTASTHSGSELSVEHHFPGHSLPSDRADFVVPSIAISLEPPSRGRSYEDSYSTPKKLLRQASRSRTSTRDSSIDTIDPHRRSSDLKSDKTSKLTRVKTRVDKLRNEVSKVEEFIPWKRDGNSVGSSIASESETDAEPRLSLDVPRPKHRTRYSTGQIPVVSTTHPLNPSRSFDSRPPGLSRANFSLPISTSHQSNLSLHQPSSPLTRPRQNRRNEATLLAAAIVARNLPRPPLPTCPQRPKHILHILSRSRQHFAKSLTPRLLNQLQTVNKTLSSTLPALHIIADTSEALETMATGELTKKANYAKNEVEKLIRRQRKKGLGRALARAGWSAVGCALVAVMWGVWAVVVVARAVWWVVRAVGKVVGWVLWI